MRILVTGAAGFIGSNVIKGIFEQLTDAVVVVLPYSLLDAIMQNVCLYSARCHFSSID